MSSKLAQRVESIKLGMQKLAEFATQAQKTAAAPAPVAQGPSPEEAAKIKELSISIGSKLAAMQLIQEDTIEKNASAFAVDHLRTLTCTAKVLDHLLSERAAAKTAGVSSMGTVVEDPATKADKKQEVYNRPRC